MGIQPFKQITKAQFSSIRPFFRGRTRKVEIVDTIVIHWTASGAKTPAKPSLNGTIRHLNKCGYGYHFIIDYDGKITQGGELTKRTGHAGNAYGPNKGNVNTTSVGISFLTSGYDYEVFNENPEIYNSCLKLILNIKEALPNLKYITGHHWVSPGRKVDPYYFPFDKLIKDLKKENKVFELWKTGYKPFPAGLTDCKCIKVDANDNCKESTGGCVGPGGESYSPGTLTSAVKNADKDEWTGSDWQSP